MSFAINNQTDVLKFALPLNDYLILNGHDEAAKALDHLVDACFPDDAQALEAHRKAYRQIRDTVPDLPSKYQVALDDALQLLSKE